MAEVGKIREHIAQETHQLGRDLKSKKQILQHFRGKWGLSDTNSKKLLQAIAPEKTGPSEAELKKREKENIDYRRFGAGALGRLRGDAVERRGAAVKQAILAPRGVGGAAGQKSSGGLASVTSIVGRRPSETGGAPQGVVGVAGRSGDLEVKKADLEVHHIEGGTGLAGGKPAEGVASVIDLNKKREEKKSAENKKTGSKPDLQLAA